MAQALSSSSAIRDSFSPFRPLHATRGRRVPASSRIIRTTNRANVRAAAEAGADTAQPSKSSTTSPFAGKKISSLLAARGLSAKPSTQPPSEPKSDTSSLADAAANPPARAPANSSLSPSLASLIKETTPVPGSPPASPFATRAASINAVPSSPAKPLVTFGKKNVLEALKSDSKDKTGVSVKIGQPTAPVNIFDDPRRSKEQIEAEKFKFELNMGQILLVLSFFASSLIMMGTVYVVWKLGAIHFNEY